ncbi:MAG TPA: hypothetical protein PLT47_11955, partial [Bacteroidales bacterium]|nr:hypothetical protein [Bacteroidales bacterium]
PFKLALSARLILAFVRALREPRTYLFRSSIKISKIQIYFIEPKKQVCFFPKGESPLCVLIEAGKH